MNKLLISFWLLFPAMTMAQTTAEKPKILYGICSKDNLSADPFGKWFISGYNDYTPNTVIADQLKRQNTDKISIEIFFGTWCGDSKREVPRFLKLLHNISFPEKKVTLIGLGNGDSLYKQSPQHEEAGKGIFRVPTFIIYKNGIEINRINEFPILSLERDLLNIISNGQYSPNYHSFALVKQWLTEDILLDDNISTAGLAQQLRLLVKNEHELNSLGYLLLNHDKKKEALRVFQINYFLYPESANVISSLGEGYYENNDLKKAISFLEKALEINKKPDDIKGILEILYKTKEKEKL